MSRLEDAMDRAETDFQRNALREWARRNPTPNTIGKPPIDLVPTLCICSKCSAPSLIIPDDEPPARGFVLCPNMFSSDHSRANGSKE
jgi:hypothetical protein